MSFAMRVLDRFVDFLALLCPTLAVEVLLEKADHFDVGAVV
jgi:hypothetical protein